jgi:hypothetical protein
LIHSGVSSWTKFVSNSLFAPYRFPEREVKKDTVSERQAQPASGVPLEHIARVDKEFALESFSEAAFVRQLSFVSSLERPLNLPLMELTGAARLSDATGSNPVRKFR